MKPSIEGANHILQTVFLGQSWYIGLFEGNYTPNGTETAANIAALATECTSFSQPNRPQAAFGAPNNGQQDNAAGLSTWTFTANKTIYGAFLVSSNVKAGTGGKNMVAVRFPNPRTVEAGESMGLYASQIFDLLNEA